MVSFEFQAIVWMRLTLQLSIILGLADLQTCRHLVPFVKVSALMSFKSVDGDLNAVKNFMHRLK